MRNGAGGLDRTAHERREVGWASSRFAGRPAMPRSGTTRPGAARWSCSRSTRCAVRSRAVHGVSRVGVVGTELHEEIAQLFTLECVERHLRHGADFNQRPTLRTAPYSADHGPLPPGDDHADEVRGHRELGTDSTLGSVGPRTPIEVIGSYRFDDPDGRVGMETHLVTAGGTLLPGSAHLSRRTARRRRGRAHHGDAALRARHALGVRRAA